MKRYNILIAALAAVMALSACVKLGSKPVEKRYYQITPIRSAQVATAQRPIILQVRRLTISDLYNTREMVYREAEGHINSDFYNLFFVSPANMLTTELRRWLRESGQFEHIIDPGSMIVPTLTLEGAINALYGDYSGSEPAAVVEMQFFVVDESTADNTIVFSRSYKERIPLTSAAPDELIKGMTLAVQHIYTALENDLAAAPLTD